LDLHPFPTRRSSDLVKVKVSVVANFGSATVSYPIQTGNDCTTTNGVKTCNWTITESYAPGAGGDVVLIQAYYKWPTIVRLPGFKDRKSTRLNSSHVK